jgi:hypothetical protein
MFSWLKCFLALANRWLYFVAVPTTTRKPPPLAVVVHFFHIKLVSVLILERLFSSPTVSVPFAAPLFRLGWDFLERCLTLLDPIAGVALPSFCLLAYVRFQTSVQYPVARRFVHH